MKMTQLYGTVISFIFILGYTVQRTNDFTGGTSDETNPYYGRLLRIPICNPYRWIR